MDILGSLSILSGRATKFKGEDPVFNKTIY